MTKTTHIIPSIAGVAVTAVAVATFSSHGAQAQAPSVVWASAARASSQYGDPDWAAHQATGAPNTASCGDLATAWASRGADDQPEWLELDFPTPVRAQAIRIVETFHPGAVRRIDGFDGGWVTLWSGTDPNSACPGVAEIALKRPRTLQRIRVHVDSPAVAGWNEVDAVGLVPVGAPRASASSAPLPVKTIAGPPLPPGTLVWASSASASTQYGDPQWAASQATGQPDTNTCGDLATAWASRTPDTQAEWLEVGFPRTVNARAIVVAETYNPGALVRIDEVGAGGVRTLWSGRDPNSACPGQAVIPLQGPHPLRRIRLHFDSPAVPGWNEIDAVGLVE